ncbi:MAG: S1 RNA-binding domain-containing protein [Chloroflexi bacterium]|nr:S1 RNA-binding domain-containing protein [Chloroflexota bacterium]
MSAEELGKRDEDLESESSAELSQVDAVAAETAGAATRDDGVTSGNAATETTSANNGNPDELASSGAESNAAVQADALAEASEADSAPSTDGADVKSDPVAEQSEPEEMAASAESETQAPAGESRAQTEKEGAPKDDDPPKYRRGQICSGVITKTSPTAVFVDLGDGDEGLVPGRELELMTRKMLESLIVGAEVDVYVVNPRNHRGETVLSINHALEELDWRKAEEFAKSKNVYEALIGGYNKGGLIVRFGRLRGFVPQSQLAEERARGMSGETPEERYSPMVNQPIGVKVMEVDRKRNRLILSERAAMREVRQRRKRELIEELTLGEIRKGTVVSLETFGAFVDIGGAEGLVHLTELAWGHITHPRQVVSVGDEVEVEVISINSDARRIGLSRRRIMSDPWDEVAGSLRRGQLVRGRVTKLTKFGAFARLIDNDAVEGLIHISELSGERVSHPREVVKRGDELVLRIVKIDIKERRLGLSLKSVNSTEYLDLDWEMAIQESASLPNDAPAADLPAEPEAHTED